MSAINEQLARVERYALESLPNKRGWPMQKTAYRATLEDVDEVATESEVKDVADWIIEYTGKSGEPPSNAKVRKNAKQICNEAGYDTSSTTWLDKVSG